MGIRNIGRTVRPKRKSLQGSFYHLTVIFFLSETALIEHHHYHCRYHDYNYDNHQIMTIMLMVMMMMIMMMVMIYTFNFLHIYPADFLKRHQKAGFLSPRSSISQ